MFAYQYMVKMTVKPAYAKIYWKNPNIKCKGFLSLQILQIITTAYTINIIMDNKKFHLLAKSSPIVIIEYMQIKTITHSKSMATIVNIKVYFILLKSLIVDDNIVIDKPK